MTDEPPREHPAHPMVDRLAFLAVLASPALFLFAHSRMQGRSPEEIAALARGIDWTLGIVLAGFALVALLRRGHSNARLQALGGLAAAVAALVALRDLASQSELTRTLVREAGAGGEVDLVTPVRLVTVALAAFSAYLFLKAGRGGAWSMTFAFAGALLAADVALLAMFV